MSLLLSSQKNLMISHISTQLNRHVAFNNIQYNLIESNISFKIIMIYELLKLSRVIHD